ncbi:hypothetical protein RYX36_027127, partial [Vicia faba]
SYVKIEHLFARKHSIDLESTCSIVYNEGISHRVVYNENEDHPVLLSGWKELQNHYLLPDDVMVVVGYYRNNSFEVVAFKPEFACVLRDKNYDVLVLCGDNGTSEM